MSLNEPGRNTIFGSSCFWRETMREPRFGPFDVRVTVLLGIALFYPALWTLTLALGGMTFLWAIARFRLPLPSAMRYVRSWLAGPWRPGQPSAFVRSPIDYGFELRKDLTPAIRMKDWSEKESDAKGRPSFPRRLLEAFGAAVR